LKHLAAVSLLMALGCGDRAGEPGDGDRGSREGRANDVELDRDGDPIEGNTTAPAAPPEPALGLERRYLLLLDDLLQLPEGDRRFTRYLSLTERIDAGASERELADERWALSELVNATSLEPELSAPVPLDAARSYLRIDLRDYRWQRPLLWDGAEYRDVWELVVEATGLGLVLEGSPAEAVADATGTQTAVLPGSALVAAASQPWLYALLVDAPASEAALIARLGGAFAIDARPSIDDLLAAGWMRAALDPGAHDFDFVDRFSMPEGAALWRAGSIDVGGGSSVFSDPLDISFALNAIYRLPNGMPAFWGFSDVERHPPPLAPGGACLSCHALGPEPVTDHMLGYLEQNERDFSAGDLAEFRRVFPGTEALATLVRANRSEHALRRGVAELPEESLGSLLRVM
jgi:hypothetical protein